MASFFTKTFSKHDDYMTPKYAWENIKDFIPKDKVIWEAFTGDGASGQYLKDITKCDVIHDGEDFFAGKKGEIIVSNPPFSHTKEIMGKLVEYDMPFILIMPSSKINTQYFRKSFSQHKDKIQIIIPRKRIHFKKLIDGEPPEGWKDRCNFDCFYYCWKMNLPRDIIWLED